MTYKILMLGRYDLFTNRGGDTVQIENTAKELTNLGANVTIKNSLEFNPKDYDLIHLFQLDWVPETYVYAKKVLESNKPYVLSPIHHNINEVKKFEDEYVFDLRRVSKVLFKDQFSRDMFKNVYRAITDARKIHPTLVTLLKGFKNTQKYTLKHAKEVLVQTEKEARDLKDLFNLDFKWSKVPNGVGKCFLNMGEVKNNLQIKDYIICVGRIEPRKNQLHVIEAVEKLREKISDLNLVFIGAFGGFKHREYTNLFKRRLDGKDWIKHILKVPYDEMPSYYKFAKVCVSASWFETTGLTSLEALFCGTNAVAAGSRAEECLGSLASYCSPDNVESISAAIQKEYFSARPVISAKIKNEFTWENAAKKTLEVYSRTIGTI